MTASDVQLSAHELAAITEWAEKAHSVTEIRLFGKPPGARGPAKDEINLAVTVTSDGKRDAGFGLFCSFADRWQKQLRETTGRHVCIWWFGPESPVYEDLRADGVLIWSLT